MSLFGRLFGGGSAAKPEPEPTLHDGFRIFPEPINEGGRYRVGARIEKEIDGEMKSHMMIRADTLESHDTAIEVSLNKAKSMIDQMGDTLFG